MKNPNQLKFVLTVSAICLGFILSPVVNADNLQAPQQIIAQVSDALQKQLQDNTFRQDFVRATQFVNQVIEPHTDFVKIAPLVLGKHWKTASPSEQEQFTQEFQTLIIRAYTRAFIEYHDWKIEFLPFDTTTTTGKTVVKTRVLQPRIQPVEVFYRMFDNKGQWKVYDIVINGVSLVTNYRSTFNEDIQRKGSLAVVIDDLAKRNAEALKPK